MQGRLEQTLAIGNVPDELTEIAQDPQVPGGSSNRYLLLLLIDGAGDGPLRAENIGCVPEILERLTGIDDR